MTILMVIIACLGVFSCGDDDDSKGNANLIQILQSNKWITRDSSYGEGSNNHSWVDLQTIYLYFTSDNAGVSYWIEKDYDTDLGNSIRTDYSLFTYSVSGNTVTITDESNNVSRYNYEGGYLVSESGSTIFESSPMTSNDYKVASSLGPKKGTCGDNLQYSFDDRTKTLTITGSGKMNDYTSSNQPWHDYAISTIFIEEGCTYIGTHAFHNLKYSVTEIDLPGSLLEIGDYAFCDLLLSDLTLPSGLVRIGKYAFSDCEYLKNVYFGFCDDLEEIGDYAFAFCPIKMSYFSAPKNLRKIGTFAFFGSSFGSLKLNNKLEDIDNQAFGKITGSKIEIPNSVKSIGILSFNGSFSEIRIGTGLNTISPVPFSTVKNGKMYVNLGKPLPITSSDNQYIIGYMYGGDASGSWTLYVPKGSKSSYQNAPGWKKFGAIIEDASLINGNGNDSGNDNQGNSSLTGTVQGHDYVDLGLSVKWATCNVGASKAEDFGWYFQWGETTTSSIPDYYTSNQCQEVYEFYEGSSSCKDIGSNIAGTQYDAAYKKWGTKWRMPTVDQWKELKNGCSWKWTSQNGVNGLLITGKNNQTLFLPAAGGMAGIWSDDYDGEGNYWTANVDSKTNQKAEVIRFSNSGSFNTPNWQSSMKYWAFSVRAVTD